jgi:hypothetical protein
MLLEKNAFNSTFAWSCKIWQILNKISRLFQETSPQSLAAVVTNWALLHLSLYSSAPKEPHAQLTLIIWLVYYPTKYVYTENLQKTDTKNSQENVGVYLKSVKFSIWNTVPSATNSLCPESRILVLVWWRGSPLLLECHKKYYKVRLNAGAKFCAMTNCSNSFNTPLLIK